MYIYVDMFIYLVPFGDHLGMIWTVHGTRLCFAPSTIRGSTGAGPSARSLGNGMKWRSGNPHRKGRDGVSAACLGGRVQGWVQVQQIRDRGWMAGWDIQDWVCLGISGRKSAMARGVEAAL